MTTKSGGGIPYRVRAGIAKVRTIYKLPFRFGVNFGAHNNDIVNLMAGLVRRFLNYEQDGKYYTFPEPDEKLWASVMDYFLEEVHPGVRGALDMDEFPYLYSGRRRTGYLEAVASLKLKDVCHRDSKVSSFVKCEKTNFTEKPDPAPRIINPRSKRYNVSVGVFVKPIEHDIYRQIDARFDRELRAYRGGFVPRVVMKGLNARERASELRLMWGRFRNPVAILLDAKKFDAHVSQCALQQEHRYYKRYYAGSERRRLAWLLRMQEKMRGAGYTTDGSVKFRRTGGRCSGDMNTAVGNVIIMSAMLLSYFKSVGVTNFEVADDGDDSVVIVESSDLARFMAGLEPYFESLGFRIKVGRVCRVFEEIEFCQAQPIDDGSGWVMVRDPRVALAKDSCTFLRIESVADLQAWLGAVGECGRSLAGGIPVWDAFYRMFVRFGVAGKHADSPQLETGMLQLARRMKRDFAPPTPIARASFGASFCITPGAQLLLEEKFDSVERIFDLSLQSSPVADFRPFTYPAEGCFKLL